MTELLGETYYLMVSPIVNVVVDAPYINEKDREDDSKFPERKAMAYLALL